MNLYQFTVDRVTASGKLNVYLTGTTTAATFYTDAAGTSAGTSPVTADGAGQFDPIYLDPAITYRIKVTNSAGSTTYYDIDPVRPAEAGTADGVLTVRSVDDARNRTVPGNVSAIYCEGYLNKGDRGEGLYVRVASVPSHAGTFDTQDGAHWDLRPNVLNPFMFGAKGDDTTNDSAAINAMFEFIRIKAVPYPVNFMGAQYYVHDALLLPKIPDSVMLDINGGGARLRTDQAITILSCPMPVDKAAAGAAIARNAFTIHNLMFQGNNATDQTGLHLIATYTSVVHSCYFEALYYGSIGTFCLASAWRDNRYLNCLKRPAVLQSADSLLTGTLLWTDATINETPSNVSVFENCRVHGNASQEAAFSIYGSDSVRMEGCVSEGNGAKYDVFFESQGSTTVKQFHVHMFHAEAPASKLNFKVRSSGQVVIDTLWTQSKAAIYDAQGSSNCDILIRGINYLGNPPVPTGLPYNATTNPNPNGRWFYHAGGNGYGDATEGSGSSGCAFRFEDCFESAYTYFSDPTKWEGGVLPVVLNVRGRLAANGGVGEYSNAAISFQGPIYLPDGSTLMGMQHGVVTSSTTSVPANSSVVETFAATGIKWNKQAIVVHPYNTAIPPAGVVWNAWIDADDQFKLRYTNVTGSAITLITNAQWRYAAPRHL